MSGYDLIHQAIMSAKLGTERKAAQHDVCSTFAVALLDVLIESGHKAEIMCAAHKHAGLREVFWYHAVVSANGKLYDSMGEFDLEIIRRRSRVHLSVRTELVIRPDDRSSCWEDELSVLHAFYVKQLRKALILAQRDPDAATDLRDVAGRSIMEKEGRK